MPWLLPLVGPVARLLVHAYYRVTVAGTPVPQGRPLLLIANHPNEAFDPLLVAAAAGRPVRFLAKAPLFSVPIVGAVLRAAGCLPIYRRSDDPALTAKNEDTFDAVTSALDGGAAIAIFPEGTSHDAPALTPFKTGAARIALGAAEAGIPLEIVPVGLVLADRDRARSEALAVLGPPLAWDDLRGATPADTDVVRELTARTAGALGAVTLNLDAWADEPLVTTAEAIYAATHPVSPDPAERVRRLWVATQWLRTLRRSGDPRYPPIAAAVKVHGRRLARLGLSPGDLNQPTDLGTALRWTGRRLPLAARGRRGDPRPAPRQRPDDPGRSGHPEPQHRRGGAGVPTSLLRLGGGAGLVGAAGDAGGSHLGAGRGTRGCWSRCRSPASPGSRCSTPGRGACIRRAGGCFSGSAGSGVDGCCRSRPRSAPDSRS